MTSKLRTSRLKTQMHLLTIKDYRFFLLYLHTCAYFQRSGQGDSQHVVAVMRATFYEYKRIEYLYFYIQLFCLVLYLFHLQFSVVAYMS